MQRRATGCSAWPRCPRPDRLDGPSHPRGRSRRTGRLRPRSDTTGAARATIRAAGRPRSSAGRRMTTQLHGGSKIDADGRSDGFWVLFDGGTIVATGTGRAPTAEVSVDLAGARITPGF